jgi:hypothetical protein
MTPRRIQFRRTKGWRKPAHTRYCGRPSIYGNPYLVCRQRSAKQAVRAYRMGLRGRWAALQKLEGHSWGQMLTVVAYFQRIRQHLAELRGWNLGCTCRLDAPCHVDPLLEVANA